MFWKEEEIAEEKRSLFKMDHRLKKNKQFSYIYKKGVRKSNKYLTLFKVSSKFTCYKIGYSISKKIGKANVRNKLKRRMKEIVKNENIAKNHFNYVLRAREGVQNLSFEDLKKVIIGIFSNEKSL